MLVDLYEQRFTLHFQVAKSTSGLPAPGLQHFRKRVLRDRDSQGWDFLQAPPRPRDPAFLFKDIRRVEHCLIEKPVAMNRWKSGIDDVLCRGRTAANVAFAHARQGQGRYFAQDIA